jgi:hypothetical protein
MNDFNLSKIRFIKFIQIFSFIVIFILVLTIFFFIITNPIFIDSSEKGNLIKLIYEIGSIVLMISVTSIIAKKLISSTIPIMQKVIIIMGGFLTSIIIYSIFLFTYFYIFGNIEFNSTNTIKHVFESIFLISFVIFFLDEFKLSPNSYIKYFQIFSFLSIILVYILLLFTSFTDIIF